jgi:acetyl-CoA/propionyl-CoA carboxylase biotin carboxyl carrier protein
MEAMKMETQITASRAGRIRVKAEAGGYLQAGQEIARYEA